MSTTIAMPARRRPRGPAHRSRPAAVPLAVLVLAAALLACSADPGPSSAAPASTFPQTPLADLRTGEPVSLDQYRGTPVVINLWATWCAPCRTEMPELEAAQQRFLDRVQFVGLTDPMNQPASLAAAAEAGVTYPLLVDTDERVQVGLGVTGLPATAFLDGAGQLLELRAGVLDASSLDETIGRLYGIT